jgi:hypothetical protein
MSAHMWMHIAGLAKLQLGAMLRRSVGYDEALRPTAIILIDDLDEARMAAKAGLALHPSFTIRRFLLAGFSDNPTYLAGWKRLGEGMRLAGLPKG